MSYLLGRTSDSELLAAVSKEPSQTHAAQLCEAHYFIGLKKNRAGQTKAAQEHFEKAVQTKAHTRSAFRGARVALKKFTNIEDAPSQTEDER